MGDHIGTQLQILLFTGKVLPSSLFLILVCI